MLGLIIFYLASTYMITLHHLENSRSQRIIWLLEELGAEYEVRRYERNKKTNLAPPELEQIHPSGKSPVITDDSSGATLTVAETGAIVEYLIEHHGNGKLVPPTDAQAYLNYRYWMHAAEGSYAPLMVMKLLFNTIQGPKVPFVIRPITKAVAGQVCKAYIDPSIAKLMGNAEKTISHSTWFAGDQMTGADIMMIFVLEGANARLSLQENYPNLYALMQRIHALPSYKKALEVGGPYELNG